MKTFSIKVKLNSKRRSIQYEDDGSLTIWLKSFSIDGKANQELMQLVAAEFGVAKACVRIKSGATLRIIRIEVDSA